MSTVQKVAVLIAATGLATALFLPGRTTAKGIGAFFGGLSQWQRSAEGLRA
jgi:hypothetical protein